MALVPILKQDQQRMDSIWREKQGNDVDDKNKLELHLDS